jgi:hypothetical protein
MTAGLRTAATLVGLTLMLFAGAAWGWAQLSEPFPGKAEPPTCVESTFSDGDKIYPQDVTVSVLNAGRREGLAALTMQLLVDDGFGKGDTANAPKGTEVAFAEIWSSDPSNPAVKLLRTRFGDIEVQDHDYNAAGVVLVVGDQFEELRDGRDSVKVHGDDVSVCGPPVE